MLQPNIFPNYSSKTSPGLLRTHAELPGAVQREPAACACVSTAPSAAGSAEEPSPKQGGSVLVSRLHNSISLFLGALRNKPGKREHPFLKEQNNPRRQQLPGVHQRWYFTIFFK